ncbi:membrane protein [Caballeronia terrestris]|uniref:Membrane protein n=1 Tax=Caballeronia terrestris TaxID=1226301 RepID=A0A158J7Z9_9BURK|nr:OmpA family protein [Caballeronia terrestris]SAL64441.1 membrane protein [Caballeronia terrestris]
MSKKLVVASILSIGVIAGCTTAAQGPTFNVYQIQTANGMKAYRAECHGAFETVAACVSAAQKVCGDQPAYKLDTMERLLAPNEDANDPRIVTFQCGAPQTAAPAPAPAPEPAQQPAPEMPRQINLSGDANFATDSATLTAKATDTLDQFIQAGQNVTFKSVHVAGYTDSTGSASHNQKLSERRAQSVMSYLKSHGLRSQNYSAQGFGASNPVASNATTAGRAQNRRVEVSVSTQQ